MSKVIRHGDVNLFATKLPKGAKKVEEVSSKTIAYGETTGHNHTITIDAPDTTFEIYEHNGNRYIALGGRATLTHPEHKTLTIAPGVYVQGQERERDHFAHVTRKVID